MRTAFVHIGTHKTGTKALQVFCAINRDALATAGIYYPRSGRVELAPGSSTPGHHQIAFDLMRSHESPALDAALAEIDAAGAPGVLLSSEELHMLLEVDGALQLLVGALRSRAYRTIAILYLRPQADYAESLYAEFAKGGRLVDFRPFFDTIVRTGEFRSADSRSNLFEYSRLIERAAGVFSPENLVVRAYRSREAPESLFADFLNVLARVRGAPIAARLRNPMPRANESPTFFALLDRACRLAGTQGVEDFLERRFPDVPRDLLETRFSLLTHEDVVRFLEGFDADNRQVNAMSGIALPTAGDLPDAADPRFERAKTHREILATLLDGVR